MKSYSEKNNKEVANTWEALDYKILIFRTKKFLK